MKTMLVLGNGFDLTHGLPTRYEDFLFFIDSISALLDDGRTDYVSYVEDEERITWIT